MPPRAPKASRRHSPGIRGSCSVSAGTCCHRRSSPASHTRSRARWRSRVRAVSRPFVWSLGVLVLLSLGAVPGLANGVLAVHTFGLERSPLTMLLGSYLKGPLRVLHAREAAPADPFCLDLTSPVPVEGTDPLIAATAKRTNVVLVILESIGAR